MKKGYSLVQVIIIIIITSIISGLAVGVIISKSGLKENGISYSDLLNDNYIQEFLQSYHEINKEYYKDVNNEELINSAIDGMMNYLNESYTSFLDENASDRLIAQINGTYKGIGIVTVDNIIIYVANDTPASNSGIMTGDILAKINDVSAIGKSNNEIATIIGNEETVKITIIRNEKPIELTMNVDIIDIPSVYYNVDNNIGYIRINAFSKNAYNEFRKGIDYLNNHNVEKLVIDLRDNTGGYLSEAKKIASIFTKKDSIIYSIENQNKKVDYKDDDDFEYNKNIVILVNKQTASASEVLASALKEHGLATLVGEKTYGKGKIQRMYSLSSGHTLKYTSATWYTPKGICVDEKGINPDFYIETEKVYNDGNITNIKDSQLTYAKELLVKK